MDNILTIPTLIIRKIKTLHLFFSFLFFFVFEWKFKILHVYIPHSAIVINVHRLSWLKMQFSPTKFIRVINLILKFFILLIISPPIYMFINVVNPILWLLTNVYRHR